MRRFDWITRFGEESHTTTARGIIRNLRTILQRTAEFRLGIFPRDLPVDVFTSSCLTHEAPKIYSAMMAEFEYQYARALCEARRQSLRV